VQGGQAGRAPASPSRPDVRADREADRVDALSRHESSEKYFIFKLTTPAPILMVYVSSSNAE
jgi:hypothetical protein